MSAAPADPLARARELAERGRFRDAFDIANGVLAADPADWRAKHLIALILWSSDLRDKAVPLMRDAVAQAPDTAEARHAHVPELLHMAAKSGLETDAARTFAEQALARHGPTFPLLEGLVTLHLARRSPASALAVAEQLVANFPDDPKSHFVLSAPLLVLGRDEDSIAAYGRGLAPYDGSAGKTRADLRQQYAALSPNYDANQLHQSFSARMARFIAETAGATDAMRILDAGCGTGLLAARLKAARWVGIDQSPDMLAKAAARGIYADLVEGDMVAAMAAREGPFDLIASTCALYHLADLAPFFGEAARLLAPGGYLFFSVDPAPDTIEIGVTTPGEYAHSRKYLRRLAADEGLAETSIRIMEHRYYAGFWCAFHK